ncbi:Co2+/Mg2+ efflux protein ApaG [Vulgatibacter incomptus]|uniref:Protein ApaG n=1 Tax=Vulgatibacter incomptus TaxID=1391653 RepID=A0A0K1PGF6_9BACT|nr:Co2+/Mg2+ efflux protein ApaG [Vulgatibacter incomptus]AKU92501.1 ApaG protein [Vulgatibacter incomptus]
MSIAVTQGIRVQVRPAFWSERSDAARGIYAFTYTIRISNEGEGPARLRRRHWFIQDGVGREEEVEGPGVVGKEPNLSPGETFEYTSWVPLQTPIGTMRGTFTMERPDGSTFEAEVAEFVLALPDALH